jgi:nicotinamide-nucleotide amidase
VDGIVSVFSRELTDKAEQLLAACRARGATIATAESCTGGLIAGCLTAVAGSSDVVERGFVTYSNDAKHQMLGVPEEMIAEHGAVSEPVARAMAEGALQRSEATLAVSVTGIAGPGGGSEEKPVGLVHMAVAGTGRDILHERHVFEGSRDVVRVLAVAAALDLLLAGTE